MSAPHTRHPRRRDAYYTHCSAKRPVKAFKFVVVATWSYAVRVNALERLESRCPDPTVSTWYGRFLEDEGRWICG